MDVNQALKDAYAQEIQTVSHYVGDSTALGDSAGARLRPVFQQNIEDELKHAGQVGDRLEQLGQQPPSAAEFDPQESAHSPQDHADLESVLEDVLVNEENEIEAYETLLEAAREADDTVTEHLATEILSEEESHRANFRTHSEQ